MDSEAGVGGANTSLPPEGVGANNMGGTEGAMGVRELGAGGGGSTRRTSRVWRYFGMVDNCHYICRLCSFVGAYTNTTNMRKHIQHHHPERFQDILDHTRPTTRPFYTPPMPRPRPPLHHHHHHQQQQNPAHHYHPGGLLYPPPALPGKRGVATKPLDVPYFHPDPTMTTQQCLATPPPTQLPTPCQQPMQGPPFPVHSHHNPAPIHGPAIAVCDPSPEETRLVSQLFPPLSDTTDCSDCSLTPSRALPPAEDRGVGGGGGGGGGNGGNVEFNQNNGEEVAVGVSTGGSSPDQYQGGDGSEREPTPAPPTPTQQKPESYQLRHNNHLTLVLEALARDESFMDVTLTAQGRSLKAHKSVLSAVSPYFRGVLRDNPCQHPIIIMPRDVRFEELFSIVNYIYKGEMTVAAEDLTSLLKTAEILQVSGLAPSDSTATFNPQHETLTTGNLRSSSTSSSASSSNTPARPIRSMKQTSQRTFTPPPRPKSGDSSINPTDFMDVDMTCVKEEVTSGGEDDDAEEQIAKLPCPQSSPGDDLHHGSDAPIHDNNLPNYSLPYDQCLQQSLPSTSSTTIFRPLTSTTEALDPSTSSIKTDPDTDLNPQLCAIETAHPMRCPHCEEQHRDIDTLLTHLRIRHPTKPSFTCGCGRVFTRQAYQQAHSKLCPNAS